MSPPISAPAGASAFIPGRRAHARTVSAKTCSPTSGIVSTEMCSPRMLCRSASEIAPYGDLPHLRAPTHDNDPLSKNSLERLHLGDGANDGKLG